jgi:MFS family permease
VYSSSRVAVNVSQVYLPLYLLTTLQLHKSAIATVPLVVYGAGLLAAKHNEAISEKLGREKAHLAGVCCALAALLIFFMIQPEPEGQLSCGLSAAHLCIPWVYFGAVLLGLGCSVLLLTAQTLVSECIPEERKQHTDTVWGCLSFVDKIANGAVIWLCQYLGPECEAGDACSGCAAADHS